MKRAHNFNAGPAALPTDVLEKASNELLNFNNTGMSVMELSHRSKDYSAVHTGVKAAIRTLLNVNDDYEILFLQGGASLQFAMIPMNFATAERPGYYVVNGSWGDKAYKEAKALGSGQLLATSKADGYRSVPTFEEQIPA
ncbi:MAG: aminotransferase class V-fold PLP-dependent enzyme, partial [Bacilli bacterium]